MFRLTEGCGRIETSLMFAQRFPVMSFVDDQTLQLSFANCAVVVFVFVAAIFIVCVFLFMTTYTSHILAI